MTDREKVIKGIDICLQRFQCGENCPYYNYEKIGCMEQLREEALELLKGQDEIIKKYKELKGFLATHGWWSSSSYQ